MSAVSGKHPELINYLKHKQKTKQYQLILLIECDQGLTIAFRLAEYHAHIWELSKIMTQTCYLVALVS